MKKTLIEIINKSNWWHVTPRDKTAYKKRGKFLASTFLQASFYGRPNNIPNKINVKNPIFGFSELEILEKLFNKIKAKRLQNNVLFSGENFYKKRISLDAKIFQRAKKLGYDSIVLMSKQGKGMLLKGRKPNSIELNIAK